MNRKKSVLLFLMCEFECVIEKIKFRNEENGYTVAVVSSNEETLVITGKFLSISIGEGFKVVGDFKTTKFGEQFDVDHYEIIEPKSIKGIEKYLSSGLIKGVGPVTAKLIVDKFGLNTLEVIEFNPDKLTAIKGISKKKTEIISQSLNQIKEMQNSMVFLQGFNISSNLAIKIYEHYKSSTIELIKKNPYRLVEDINGVGFISADKIALKMGIARDSIFRVRAGVLYLLTEASEKGGHTYQFVEQIKTTLNKLLNLQNDHSSNIVEDAFEILQKENIIKIFWKEKKQIICLTKLYNIEKNVANKIIKICYNISQNNLNIEKEIELYEKKKNILLHSDQKKAVDLAINSGICVITGGPGTGKTTIVSCILEILKSLNKKTILLAPTGRAAKRLSETTNFSASTIHRALEINFKQDKNIFVYNEDNPLNCDAVIIDEVSMVDINLMYYFLKAFPEGAKLILVGDKDQLPSVGVGNVLEDIISSNTIPVISLTKIYRQENNSLIIQNAHLINNGENPILDNRSSDFFFESKSNNDEIFESVINLVISRINKYLKIDSKKIQVLSAMRSGICGVENLNEKLQEKINPASEYKNELYIGSTILRELDKIMQITNNYNLEWSRKIEGTNKIEFGKGVFNGDMGEIKRIDNQSGEVEIIFDDKKTVIYPRSELNQISLAYAITIHKSQGSEFDVVVIPVISGPSLILTRNLIYTGVTRAKKMVVLVGSINSLNRMIKNKQATRRLTLLKEFLHESKEKIRLLYGK